jgi:hypothetical protein
MSFYGTATGDPSKAFTPEFTLIPNNTSALAKIKSFEVISKDTQYAGAQKFFQIVWEIVSEEFKGRQITQKIKAFNGKPEQIERNLNMLLLIMKLSDFQPLHDNEPNNQELMRMNGKIHGIKIREWSMEKEDGSGTAEGNFVAEVHPATGFNVEKGEKIERVHSSPVESAFSRNAQNKGPELDMDIPF